MLRDGYGNLGTGSRQAVQRTMDNCTRSLVSTCRRDALTTPGGGGNHDSLERLVSRGCAGGWGGTSPHPRDGNVTVASEEELALTRSFATARDYAECCAHSNPPTPL